MKTKNKKIIIVVSIVLFFPFLSGFYLNFFPPHVVNENTLAISLDDLIFALSISVLLLFSYNKYFEARDKIHSLKLRYIESYDEKGLELSEKLKPVLGPALLLLALIIYSFLFIFFSLGNFFIFFSYYYHDFIGSVLLGFYIVVLFLVLILFLVALWSLRLEKAIFDKIRLLIFHQE